MTTDSCSSILSIIGNDELRAISGPDRNIYMRHGPLRARMHLIINISGALSFADAIIKVTQDLAV